MKFENAEYLKHKNCLDAFIRVKTVMVDTGKVAIVYAYWMVQGTEKYWYASDVDRFKVTQDEYENWLPYEPKGERFL